LRGDFDLLLLSILTTMAAVGVYSAAGRVQMVGGMFLMAAEMVAKPIIADLHHKGDTVQLDRLYQTLTRWSFVFVLPYFCTVLLFADPILTIFGEEFSQGSTVLIVVSIGTLVQGATGICEATIVMTGRSRLAFLNSLIATGLSVTLASILIPRWGLPGAAVAHSLSTALINILGLVQVFWLHGLWPYNREFIKPLVASAVALAASHVMSQLWPAHESIDYLFMDVAVFWSTYVAATILLGLSAEDIAVLRHTRTRFAAVLRRVERKSIG
ncbi:MAG: polysaccharide biosynthesis C-terminal domain-containing protein, partial [bacterium]